jgi:hypothetical protein
MQVPAASSSLMLRNYSVINRHTPNPYEGDLFDNGGNLALMAPAVRIAHQQSPFGHLLNFFMTTSLPAQTTSPGGGIEQTGAPHYYRLLEYVHVPSRYVGTETILAPEVFNDVPGQDDTVNTVGVAIGSNIDDPSDPRYKFQPPFNKVSQQRDPGKVNLNTVVGRREVDQATNNPHVWSEVYDGIMHRYRDGNLFDDGNPFATATNNLLQLSHFGPAWRDVVLSRKGYAQYNADDPGTDNPIEKPAPGAPPDVLTFGLNPGFPTVFGNPFRSPDAGDLVPLIQMMQYGVDASWLRVHPRTLGDDGAWGAAGFDDDNSGLVDDMRDAGFGDDEISHRGPGDFRAIPEEEFGDDDRTYNPLFSESAPTPALDPYRNPYMMYQPMTRLGNLVTTRSNVYAVWVTVGYFEVEPAPDWNSNEDNVQQRFGGDGTAGSTATLAAKALYDRVYPEGYRLGRELGADTGNTRRERAFYIIDRTLPVGFKPGDDLNVENTILVRRRIE